MDMIYQIEIFCKCLCAQRPDKKLPIPSRLTQNGELYTPISPLLFLF